MIEREITISQDAYNALMAANNDLQTILNVLGDIADLNYDRTELFFNGRDLSVVLKAILHSWYQDKLAELQCKVEKEGSGE